MREGIHPNYYQAKVVCNCGNEFVTGSTKEEIHVEICSKCHSFYTGQQKAVKARGAIDKFNRRYGINANQRDIWPGRPVFQMVTVPLWYCDHLC